MLLFLNYSNNFDLSYEIERNNRLIDYRSIDRTYWERERERDIDDKRKKKIWIEILHVKRKKKKKKERKKKETSNKFYKLVDSD